ncbi:hypothetical protein V8E51_010760 [Hyaloscypha variabilis]
MWWQLSDFVCLCMAVCVLRNILIVSSGSFSHVWLFLHFVRSLSAAVLVSCKSRSSTRMFSSEILGLFVQWFGSPSLTVSLEMVCWHLIRRLWRWSATTT